MYNEWFFLFEEEVIFFVQVISIFVFLMNVETSESVMLSYTRLLFRSYTFVCFNRVLECVKVLLKLYGEYFYLAFSPTVKTGN